MIRLTTPSGQIEFVTPAAIARISQAGPGAEYASAVRTFDGKTIEAREQSGELALLAARFIATGRVV